MKKQLDLAQAQFIGFKHGKWERHNVVGLVTSMGLTKKEWSKLKSDYNIEADLEQEEIEEINNFFRF